MKIRLIILSIAFIIFGFSQNHAQNQSSKEQKEIIEPVEYVFILQIAANSNLILLVQDTESIDNIGSISDTNALIDFFSLLNDEKNSKTNLRKRKINPTIIVKADPSLNYGVVLDFLKKVRQISGREIKLEISKNFSEPFVFIPRDPNNNSDNVVKPNPNMLVVAITPERKITLNNEPSGTLYDLSILKKQLEEIFKAREENGVFREETNEIEKTIFVKADRSLQFSEIVRLVEAIKETGASPVGLQIDDLPDYLPTDIREELIKNIEDNPK